VAPLKPAEDAVTIITDHLTIDEVAGAIMAEVRKWQDG
jgi:cytidylate kinase